MKTVEIWHDEDGVWVEGMTVEGVALHGPFVTEGEAAVVAAALRRKAWKHMVDQRADRTFAEYEGARLARRALAGRDVAVGTWQDAGYATPEACARALLGDEADGTGAYDVAVQLVAKALRGEEAR